MNYFGVLNKDTFGKLNNLEKVDYLIINNLFEYAQEKIYMSEGIVHEFKQVKWQLVSSAKLFLLTMVEFLELVKNNGLKNESFYYTDEFGKTIIVFIEENNETKCVKLEPSQNLLDDFYSFIIKKYENEILLAKYKFYGEFNEDIFGLQSKKQKKLALKRYKEIYNSLFQGNAIYIPDSYSEKDLNDFTIDNKLDLVLYNKLNYQHSIINLNSYFEYLYGSMSHFNDNFYIKSHEIIDSVIKYESLKQIMEELNSKYSFEILQDFKKKPVASDQLPLSNFIIHENRNEIEKRIKDHFSDLSGKNLRFLIEYLVEEKVLLLNYGDKTKIYNSISNLFGGKNIGAYTTIFDAKVFTSSDQNYLNNKSLFKKIFKDIL